MAFDTGDREKSEVWPWIVIAVSLFILGVFASHFDGIDWGNLR